MEQFTVGQWAWHVDAVSVVRIEAINGDELDITFHAFGMSCPHPQSGTGVKYIALAGSIVPLAEAPFYVTNLLRDWAEALAMDALRGPVGQDIPDASVTITMPAITADRILNALETLVSHTGQLSHRELLDDVRVVFAPAMGARIGVDKASGPDTTVSAFPWTVAAHPNLAGQWGVARTVMFNSDGTRTQRTEWAENGRSWALARNAERLAQILNSEQVNGHYLVPNPHTANNVDVFRATDLSFVCTILGLEAARQHVAQ